jgi:hypothetical protein
MTATELATIIRAHRFRFATEAQLQQAIAKLLTDSGIEHEAEVRLTPASRIDFMVGEIGIEIKVGHPLGSVVKQLHRYAQIERLKELLLITNRCRHSLIPETINGKRLEVVFLGWGMLS